MHRLLEKLSRVILRHPAKLWIGAGILTAILLPGLFALSINNDYSELLPRKSPALRALKDLSRDLDGLGDLTILLEGAPMESLTAFGEKLVERLSKDPLIRQARYRTPTDYFDQRKFLYLETGELREFVDATKQLIKEERLKHAPGVLDLGVESDAEERLNELKRKYELDDYTAYFADKKREKLLVLVSPRAFPDDIEAAERLRALSDEAVAQIRRDPAFAAVRTGYGGPYVDLLHENDLLNRDSAVGTLITLVLLFLLLALTYRRGLALLVIFAPLLVPMLWSYCLAGFAAPEGLNSMSAFLGMILFGLGSDFSVLLLNRYGEERRAGRSVEESIRTIVTHTGVSTFYAAATTAASFFVLLLAHFRGYAQFGLLAGLGISVAWVGIVVLLPALLLLLVRGGREEFALRVPSGHDFFERATEPPSRRPLPFLLAAGVLTAFTGFHSLGLNVDFDVARLRPTSPEMERVDAVAREVLESDALPAVYRVHGEEKLDDLLEALAKAGEGLPEPLLQKVRSVRDLLPRDEAAKRELLSDLDRALQRERNLADDPDDIREIDKLRADLSPPASPIEGLPAEIARDFRFGEEGYLVYAFPDPRKMEQEESVLSFVERYSDIHGARGTYAAAGPPLIEAEIVTRLLREGPRVMLYAVVAVVLLVVLMLMTVRHSLLALLTLALGFLWTAGIAALLGETINVFNVVTIPAIVGLSIDYPIHVSHRYQIEGEGSVPRILRAIAHGLAICVLTTVVGFLGLLLAHHPGLRSLGALAITGLLCGLASTLYFFPALVAVLERRRHPPPP